MPIASIVPVKLAPLEPAVLILISVLYEQCLLPVRCWLNIAFCWNSAGRMVPIASIVLVKLALLEPAVVIRISVLYEQCLLPV